MKHILFFLTSISLVFPSLLLAESIFYNNRYYNGEIGKNSLGIQVPHGLGTLYNADGQKVYYGEWKDGEPHGLGEFYRNGKRVFVGSWENGRKGKGFVIQDNKTFRGIWKDGEFTGILTSQP